MAIQSRRGYEEDFDPEKMLPGEWAVSLDTKYVRMCFAPGECLRMATYEAFEQDMEQIQTILAECQNIQDAIEQIQQNITDSVLVVERYVASAKTYSETAASEADRATTEADRAKAEADKASSLANIGIATTENAGIVKPDGNTITVGPDGTISATAQGGASSWNDLSDKPFNTIGNGLSVSGDALTVDFTKVQQTESGKGLSTNDYTDADADKLAGVEENANNYSLPVADSDTLGGIKPDGTTITVDENGVASAVGGGGSVDVLDTYEEIMANTASGKAAGSKGVKEGFAEINNNLGGLRFGVDGDGNYGYYGADDSLIPFKSGAEKYTINFTSDLGSNAYYQIKAYLKDYTDNYADLTTDNIVVDFFKSNVQLYGATYYTSVSMYYDADTSLITLELMNSTSTGTHGFYQSKATFDVYIMR